MKPAISKKLISTILLVSALPAWAGMSSYVLTDLAKARIEVISFLVLVYLVLTFVVKALWNGLSNTFPSMPKLNFRRALSLMLVSGLFMYVILTMISGARELMTPGAWQKEGTAYRLHDGQTEQRRLALVRLKTALWDYAVKNEGGFPKNMFTSGIPRSLWFIPAENTYFSYLPPGSHEKVLVFEPATVGPKRYVLTIQGEIALWSDGEIKNALDSKR